jgi:small subunit ribosomal protein S7
MMRRPTASAVTLKPDPRFKSVLVSKFVNCLMKDGEKSVAHRVFYAAMDIVQQKVKDAEPLEAFETAVNNVKPMVEVRSKRVGGATYQVPMPVSKQRQQSLAIRWLIQAAREKKGRPMAMRLADELVDAFHRQGAAMTRRENIHKMAEANKAFAHFAW